MVLPLSWFRPSSGSFWLLLGWKTIHVKRAPGVKAGHLIFISLVDVTFDGCNARHLLKMESNLCMNRFWFILEYCYVIWLYRPGPKLSQTVLLVFTKFRINKLANSFSRPVNLILPGGGAHRITLVLSCLVLSIGYVAPYNHIFYWTFYNYICNAWQL